MQLNAAHITVCHRYFLYVCECSQGSSEYRHIAEIHIIQSPGGNALVICPARSSRRILAFRRLWNSSQFVCLQMLLLQQLCDVVLACRHRSSPVHRQPGQSHISGKCQNYHQWSCLRCESVPCNMPTADILLWSTSGQPGMLWVHVCVW